MMEYYIAERKMEFLLFATAWLELERIMLSEISQAVRDKYHICLLYTSDAADEHRDV